MSEINKVCGIFEITRMVRPPVFILPALLNHQRLICVPLMWAVSVFPVNDGRLNIINGPKRHSWKCTNPPTWDHPVFPFKYQLLTVLAKAYILYKLGDLFKGQLEIFYIFQNV